MDGPSLSLRFNLAVLMTCLAFAAPNSTRAENTEDQQPIIRLVAEAAIDSARRIAVGISSLTNLRVEMADIDVNWVIAPERSLISRLDAASDMALLDLSRTDLDGLESDFGAVMTFWPSNDVDDGKADANPGYMLVARSSVSPDFVEALLEAIRDDSIILKAAHIDVDKLDPMVSMAASSLSVHEGAGAYLATIGATSSTPIDVSSLSNAPGSNERSLKDSSTIAQTPIMDLAPMASIQNKGRSFTLYFDTDEASLDREDFLSVADACRYAATLNRARFLISGHTDTVGPEVYNDKLAERRAAEVANAIRNDPRFREALSTFDYGELMLAVQTDDEVPEPMNRRVEITVLEDN